MKSSELSAHLSVAMCTFNGARHIPQQLASIFQQSVRPTQIVIADDGSSDSTLDIARRMLDEDQRSGGSRIGYTLVGPSDGQLGVTANFVRAIQACTSPLIALSDQDDVWPRDRVQQYLQAFDDQDECLLIASDARLVDANGMPLGYSLFESLGVRPEELLALNGDQPMEALIRRNILAGMSFVFRRELLETALPIPNPWMHDYWLATIAALLGGLSVLDEKLTDYRQHDSNALGARPKDFRFRLNKALSGSSDAQYRAECFAQLHERAVSIASAVPTETVARVAGKAAFERDRAQLSANGLGRVIRILAMVANGRYRQHASHGNANAVRDVAQGSLRFPYTRSS